MLILAVYWSFIKHDAIKTCGGEGVGLVSVILNLVTRSISLFSAFHTSMETAFHRWMEGTMWSLAIAVVLCMLLSVKTPE